MVSNPAGVTDIVCYPDGSQEPSFAYKHKQLITLRPTISGNITFASIPGIYGGIMVNSGVGFDATVPESASTADWTATTTPAFTTMGSGQTLAANSFIIPYVETVNSVLGKAMDVKNSLQFTPSKFRVLAQELTVRYTGTSLDDSGSVVVARNNMSPTVTTNVLGNGRGNNIIYAVQSIPNAADEIYAISNSRTESARKSMCSRVVNTTPEFHSIIDDCVISSPGRTLTGLAKYQGGTLGPAPSFNIDHNVPLTIYCYRGLANSASITVEVTTIS